VILRNTRNAWGLVSVTFHWVMAALFLGQFGLGWYMQGVPGLVTKFYLYQWHKSFGLLILGLAVFRALWMLTSLRPAFPETMPDGERKIAISTHLILYGLLFAVPLTGWAVVSTSPLMIPTLVFGWFIMPHLPLSISLSSEQTWSSLHGFLAYIAIFLAAVHILAAFRHHYHYRDGTLLRMLRPGHGGKRDAP
jgi:cytochrome b561